MNVTLKTREYLNGYDQECMQFYLEVTTGPKTINVNVFSAQKSYYPAQIKRNWVEARAAVWGALSWQQNWLRTEGLDHWSVWEAYRSG